ncbi:transcriptional regulator, DeoR family [Terriglobus roseus]|uniref:Transcriptional regulator, DeoR family n=2 Tax=Terriglobus roseus TaxID=392734 RepID=A0A1G7GSU2_9BACT|nr:transcriptional regulator, DeoR family [Terriglobus roseus]
MLTEMPRTSDKLLIRQDKILKLLHANRSVTVEELCRSLEASLATVRRDLEQLESRSLLKRTRGGAIPIGPLFYEPFRNDQSFQDKISSFAEEKRRIAAAAAQLVSRGQTIVLSGGTTTTEVVRSLKTLSGITIVTNAVNVAMELSNHKDIDVILTGGYLRGNWFTLVGPIANQGSEMIFSDIMILGVDGIDAKLGLTCTNAAEAELLRRLASHAKQKVVVCDRSKLGNVSQWSLCDTKEIQHIITDSGASDDAVAPFEKLGIRVSRV